MDQLSSLWDKVSRGTEDLLKNTGDALENTNREFSRGTGELLKGTGDGLIFAGHRINEASRAITGGTMMDPVRERYDLGFMTIQGPKKSCERDAESLSAKSTPLASARRGATRMGSGASRIASGATRTGSGRTAGCDYEDEDEEAGAASGRRSEFEHVEDSADDARHVGFIKIVRKKQPAPPKKHVPKAHFSDGWKRKEGGSLHKASEHYHSSSVKTSWRPH